MEVDLKGTVYTEVRAYIDGKSFLYSINTSDEDIAVNLFKEIYPEAVINSVHKFYRKMVLSTSKDTFEKVTLRKKK